MYARLLLRYIEPAAVSGMVSELSYKQYSRLEKPGFDSQPQRLTYNNANNNKSTPSRSKEK